MVKTHQASSLSSFFIVSKTSPVPKTSKKHKCCIQDPKPWNAINHAKRTIEWRRKHIRWSHAKRFCGYFPSLQIQVFIRGVTTKLKGIILPIVSLSLLLIFPVFVHIRNSSHLFLSESHKKWAVQVYPKAPERKWAFPSVGNTVSVFTLHSSCHRVSGWD